MQAMAIRLGIDLAQQRMTWDELASRTRFCEELGFDGVWGFDHFQPMYGSGPGECFEGMTTLAALGGITERTRLGLLVTGVTYRHPAVFAAEAMTIDQSTHGRLELSLGAAWFDRELHALGIPFPSTRERIERLDDALSIVRGLLTTDGFTYEGRHFQVQDATLLPRPVQQPHPPIWIGASGEKRMLPLVAKHADVWHTFGDASSLERKSHLLDDLATAAGRDPASILRASSLSISEPWDEVREAAASLRAIGVGYFVVGWPAEGRDRVAEFWDTVAPELLAD
jgi:alkanesulfonate monooxygenase SsuD/methylene tetrahydromethanopterin reductase-like flavin-dependent oxidoreductase (luciferase family)